ncbi:MAG TPA: hypothetical protein PK765_06345 [bacterium]|nr:hypothetical protein [bacterium]
MKIHTVKSRETIGAIASNHGLDSYGTLLWLNELVSATEKSGIKPLRDPTGRRIWPGETLLVPNDPVAAKTIIGITESMRRRVESSKRATDIAAGDTRAFREEVSREPFYPKSPLPVGWQDALTAMVMQGQSYRGRHSRILTIDHEHETLCSQMVMSAKSQAVPLRHMDPSDRRFQLSKGKDAWRLPKIEPNYGPLSTENGRDPYNFNGLFDPKLVANPEKASPIPERNREAYAERLDQLSHRLTDTTNPAPIGTQITVHYQRSGSRQKALDASAGLPPEQASYGTHLLVLAAVTDPEHPDPRQRMPIKRFFGWEVPEVDRGRQTPFGSDREGSRHELDRLQSSLREDITRLDRARDAVDAALDPTQNQRVRESLDARKRRVRTELTRPTTGVALDNRGRVDTDFLAYLESLLFASDPKAAYADYLQDTAHGWVEHNGKTIRLKGRWKVDPGSWKWLSEQLGSESIRTQRSIDRIREGLSGTWSVAVLDTRSEPVLARLPEMRDRISRHNANAESVLRLQSEVSRLRSELSNAERDRSDHSDSLRRQIELAESEIDTLVEACIRERIEIVSTTARISAGTESESERRAALPFKTLLQECLPNAFGQ